uniref:Ig-like domain-containing protein n=1 Tax=Heterorhabditis bacteriophora TaxID=37862 RepID=A0A1I7XLE7_HETBA
MLEKSASSSRRHLFFQLILISVLLLSLLGASYAHTAARGNLEVVIRIEGLISTDTKTLRAATPDLWCQASRDGEIQTITWARFIRVKDRKVFEARLDPDNKRARLVFGDAAASDSGKYRCEIRMQDGELVSGNMFAYSRPIVHSDGSVSFSVSPSDPTLAIGSATSAIVGGSAHLTCPVLAYPTPNIVWYKNGIPLESSSKVTIHKTSVQIDNIEDEDSGQYRCVATNQFPMYLDGPEQEFEVKVDQELKVTGNYGWLLPLIVILITLLLLFLIIYSCQAYKRYKNNQYNVAERECV